MNFQSNVKFNTVVSIRMRYDVLIAYKCIQVFYVLKVRLNGVLKYKSGGR